MRGTGGSGSAGLCSGKLLRKLLRKIMINKASRDPHRCGASCHPTITLEQGHSVQRPSASPMGNQVKAAKTQTWRLQVAPERHQAVAARATCLIQAAGPESHVADAGGSVSEAMHAVSRRRI